MTAHLALAAGVALASPGEPVFVSVAEARALIERDKAAVLDARDAAKPPYIAGSRVIDWLDFRDGVARTGRLDDDLERVRSRLMSLGVSSGRPVVVAGAMAEGWGEEARIWWMLRYLGHPKVRIIDGGVSVWKESGAPVADQPLGPAGPGALTFAIDPTVRADWRAVDGARKRRDAVVLDVRTLREYSGDRLYFEARGGHVPGARHLEWRELIGRDGKLRPRELIKKRLAALGATPDRAVIAYCTGGVRSAFVVAALLDAGFASAANYDGSWWDWSAREDLEIER